MHSKRASLEFVWNRQELQAARRCWVGLKAHADTRDDARMCWSALRKNQTKPAPSSSSLEAKRARLVAFNQRIVEARAYVELVAEGGRAAADAAQEATGSEAWQQAEVLSLAGQLHKEQQLVEQLERRLLKQAGAIAGVAAAAAAGTAGSGQSQPAAGGASLQSGAQRQPSQAMAVKNGNL